MKKYFFLFLSVILSCQNNPQKATKSATSSGETIISKSPYKCNYDYQKKRCKELFQENKKNSTSFSEKKLIAYISDSLLPCWYGTPWDFNGITQQPQTGKIACGYFVTTVLQDAGMPIERVKLAQCASQQMIEATCTDISKYSNKPLENFIEEVQKKGPGLYITGLDNHTGFILNDEKEIYFIHASFYSTKCTVKEKAIRSAVLRNSKYRVLGKVKF